jgi:hypothetical protein
MTAPGVLGLDPARITGWAYGRAGDAVPDCGTWRLAGTGQLGKSCAALENELIDAVARFCPAVVVQERALVVEDGAARFLLGLSATVEHACYRLAVRCVSAAAGDIRRRVMGEARFPPGETKQRVMAFCRAAGWECCDDNAADACVVWKFGVLACLGGTPRRAA